MPRLRSTPLSPPMRIGLVQNFKWWNRSTIFFPGKDFFAGLYATIRLGIEFVINMLFRIRALKTLRRRVGKGVSISSVFAQMRGSEAK